MTNIETEVSYTVETNNPRMCIDMMSEAWTLKLKHVKITDDSNGQNMNGILYIVHIK
jgi:hypothetical protein